MASGSENSNVVDGIAPVQNRMVIEEDLNLSPMSPDEFLFTIPHSPIGANENRPALVPGTEMLIDMDALIFIRL